MAKIMIMAGGTGGHVFPGLALAEVLQSKGIEVCWLGTVNGMERTWVEKAEIPFQNVSIKGLRGNGLLGWLKAPWNVLRATIQARSIIANFEPDLVLGMGGFVCGPGGLAAKSKSIPLVLHEQNAIPGMTNKWLSSLAEMVITAFPQDKISGSHIQQLGNPVREGLEQIPVVSGEQNPKRILVVGGSRGALVLNQTLPLALKKLPENKRPVILHQTGSKTLLEAQQAYVNAGFDMSDSLQVVPFIDDMLTAYHQADLVVCRSGALTVSELMAAARPAIMIPFPFAVDDHQTANAKVLVNMDGGVCIDQSELTAEKLAEQLELWLDAERLSKASEAIRNRSPQQAKEKIVDALLAILNKENDE